jgi:hypothetical protein
LTYRYGIDFTASSVEYEQVAEQVDHVATKAARYSIGGTCFNGFYMEEL